MILAGVDQEKSIKNVITLTELMILEDKLYGKFEVMSSALIELINSPEVQRLKRINPKFKMLLEKERQKNEKGYFMLDYRQYQFAV